MSDRLISFTAMAMDHVREMVARYEHMVTHAEMFANPATDGRTIALRHDVDNRLEPAIGMFEWEEHHGIRSTYFFQHDLSYFPSRAMLDLCHRIEAHGSEVAIHNNAIANRIRTGVTCREQLEEACEYLRGHGLTITGSSSHGDGLCHRYGFTNDECFAECPPINRLGEPCRTIVTDDGRRFDIERFSRADIGLTWGAHDHHMCKTNSYLSDTGGGFPPEALEKMVAAFRSDRRPVVSVVLMHPERWPVY